MSWHERVQDCVSEAVKCSPVIAGGVSQSFYDVTLPHILNILLVVYTAAQLAYLCWKWRNAVKAKQAQGEQNAQVESGTAGDSK